MMKDSVKKRVNKRFGFTLIEVVLACFLLSVIVVSVFQVCNSLIESKIILDDKNDGTKVSLAVVNRLVKELQKSYGEAQLISYTGENYPPRVALRGESKLLPNNNSGDELIFLAQEAGQYMPQGETRSGLVQIRYRLQADPEDREKKVYYLVREEIPYLRPTNLALEKKLIFPVTDRVKSISFNYLNPSNQQWSSSWGEEGRFGLPSAIKINLIIVSPKGREIQLSTVVALGISQQHG
jgi:type II secretion system protein J